MKYSTQKHILKNFDPEKTVGGNVALINPQWVKERIRYLGRGRGSNNDTCLVAVPLPTEPGAGST